VANAEKKQRNARGTNPNSRANLKPFEKGKSGNPKGMEVGTVQNKTRLLRMLETVAPEVAKELPAIAEFAKELPSVTNIDAVNARLLYKAIIEGDLAAIKEIYDRIEGKAPQSLDIGNKPGETFQIHRVIKPKANDGD
jgi:hypothetical protein